MSIIYDYEAIAAKRRGARWPEHTPEAVCLASEGEKQQSPELPGDSYGYGVPDGYFAQRSDHKNLK